MTARELARLIQAADPDGPFLWPHLLRKRYVTIAKRVLMALRGAA